MDLIEHKSIGDKIENRHPWELARLEVITRLIKANINMPELGTILDIGCGDTFILENIAHTFPGFNMIGVDTSFSHEILSELNKSLMSKHKKLYLYDSMEGASGNLKGNISLVMMLDVIEHVEDDLGFLKSIIKHEKVTNNTSFLLTVPAFQRLFSSHDIFLKHHRRYSIKSLRRAIRQAGLHEVRSGYFFSSLLPFRLFQVLKEKNSGLPNYTTGLITWKNEGKLTTFFKRILLFDFHLCNTLNSFGIKIPGLSCYFICRPRK